MNRWKRASVVWIGVFLLLAACAAPQPQARSGEQPAVEQPRIKKRATLAATSSLVAVGSTFVATLPGATDVEFILNAGLSRRSNTVPRQAQLAEMLPSTDNGLWKVLPDGRMETTWKLRPNVVWHDGTPFTAQDLVFTFGIYTDGEIPFRGVPLHRHVEALDPLDAHTLLIRWKGPVIAADEIFADADLPLPKHLLEAPYQANKETFPGLSFWSRDYVGTGPFRIKEWAEDSHTILEANPQYFLGRPLIDEIEVKFIPNANTLVANLMAGVVDMTLSRGMSIVQAAEVRGLDGRIELASDSPNHLAPQHGSIREPEILGNIQFRRAMMEAIDRQEMASALTSGLGPVAHSGLPYGDPTYSHAEAGVVRYDYDPRRAAQRLEALGYVRGADGKLVDAAGAPLRVELRASEKDINVKTILAAADYWNRVGVTAETYVLPAALQANTEFSRVYKGFETGGGFGSLRLLENLTESEIPTARNAFRGRNSGQYVNGDLQTLVQRYMTTIPLTERMETLRSVFHHMTDNLVTLYLYYEVNPTFISNRLLNVRNGYYGDVHLWDVK